MTKKKDHKKKHGKDKAAKAKVQTPSGPGAYVARVFVSLKSTVNDPEGITIGSALGSLGFENVTGVRSGRYFQVTLDAPDANAAGAQVDQMCGRLLANPVIETYSFEVSRA